MLFTRPKRVTAVEIPPLSQQLNSTKMWVSLRGFVWGRDLTDFDE